MLSPGVWHTYQPLLRADFRLFDEYEPPVDARAKQPLSCPLALFHAARDRRVTREMVEVSEKEECVRCHAVMIQGSFFLYINQSIVLTHYYSVCC